MHEMARGWHDRRVGNLPPRMLAPRDFYTELLAPASRFRRPLSLLKRARLEIEAALVPRLVSTSDLTWYVEEGAPLHWRLILNYLHHVGVIMTPQTIPTRTSNGMPEKKNILLRSRLPALHKGDKERLLYSSGTHDDLEIAFSKAVGEVLERVSCARPSGVKVLTASVERMRQLRAPIIDPTHVALYSSEQREQFPRLSVRESDTFDWVRCREMVSGRGALAPLDYFYWHRSHHVPHAPFLYPATTSGMAGGFSRAEALEAALREYIERDAFLAWWLTEQSPPRIHVDAHPSPRLRTALEEAERCGIEVHFLNLTRDLAIPVVACVLVRRKEPLLTVGASAKSDPETALISAYEEALSVMASDGMTESTDVTFDPASYVPFTRHDIGLKQRSVFYRGEDRLRLARFFYAGTPVSYTDFARAYAASDAAHGGVRSLVARLAAQGCRIYVHYPGHRALRRLRYHTVSVFIPELLPMYLNETDAPLAHPRLAKLLQDTGREAPYPYPHPFP